MMTSFAVTDEAITVASVALQHRAAASNAATAPAGGERGVGFGGGAASSASSLASASATAQWRCAARSAPVSW